MRLSSFVKKKVKKIRDKLKNSTKQEEPHKSEYKKDLLHERAHYFDCKYGKIVPRLYNFSPVSRSGLESEMAMPCSKKNTEKGFVPVSEYILYVLNSDLTDRQKSLLNSLESLQFRKKTDFSQDSETESMLKLTKIYHRLLKRQIKMNRKLMNQSQCRLTDQRLLEKVEDLDTEKSSCHNGCPDKTDQLRHVHRNKNGNCSPTKDGNGFEFMKDYKQSPFTCRCTSPSDKENLKDCAWGDTQYLSPNYVTCSQKFNTKHQGDSDEKKINTKHLVDSNETFDVLRCSNGSDKHYEVTGKIDSVNIEPEAMTGMIEIKYSSRFGTINKSHCKAVASLVDQRLFGKDTTPSTEICLFLQESAADSNAMKTLRTDLVHDCLKAYFFPCRECITINLQKDLNQFLARTVFKDKKWLKDIFGVRHNMDDRGGFKAVLFIAKIISALVRHPDVCLIDTLTILLGIEKSELLILQH